MRRLRQRLARFRRRMLYEAQLAAESCVNCRQFPHTQQPVWLLGCKYSAIDGRQQLQADFVTRVWMTYRRNFPPIGEDGPTSDRGWGCMLRCGQMILAETLQRQVHDRKWRWTDSCRDAMYLKMMNMFADEPEAPYSIHQIALTGEQTADKPVGTWFGPNTVGQALKVVVANDKWLRPVVHVAMDSCLVREDVLQEVRDSDGVWRRPLLLLIPLRLGLTELNPVYSASVQACFTIPHVVGIIGGTPNHALYFVGCVGDRLVYLDPHTTQPAACTGSKLTEEESEADSSYHCSYPSFMRLGAMDPSMAVAFFCKNEVEFESLCEHVQRILIDNEKHPMFELCDKRPSWQTDYESGTEAVSLDYDNAQGATGGAANDTDDEFVVL